MGIDINMNMKEEYKTRVDWQPIKTSRYNDTDILVVGYDYKS